METYVLSKNDLKIQSLCKISDYAINLDEETNSKTQFQMLKTEGLEDGNFIVVNGLYKQFLFVIPKDGVSTEKGSKLATVTALDISNIFDRKVIEKNTEEMQTKSIEEFIANTMYENFINSDDSFLNINYIDIYWHTNTQGSVATNAENGLYNFHTFLTNCRQYKNIYTDFKFENGRLRIDIQYKEEETVLIDTTLPEVVGYNKIYEEDVTAKVQCYIREDGSEYNLYLKTDRTTTTDKYDPDRAKGKIEVISVDTVENAPEQALNVMKGNNYKHLVEFKIAKTSKLMDITKLTVGRPIRIRTEDSIYDSYISAITLTDENFVYFKSGSLRMNLIDKLKKTKEGTGNKLDVSGGVIKGNLNVTEGVIANILEATKILLGGASESDVPLVLPLSQYFYNIPAIDLNNSDIVGANAIVMNDECNSEQEGILFLKQGAESKSKNEEDYETLRGYRGNLYYNGIKILTEQGATVKDNIRYEMYDNTDRIPLEVFGGNVNGIGISIGDGGATIIGAGESPKRLMEELSPTAEQLHFISDGAIYLYTNANTYEDKLGICISSQGNIYPLTANTFNFGTANYPFATGFIKSLTVSELRDTDLGVSIVSGDSTHAYFGTGSGSSGITNILRGNTVRIYAHSGGAVYLGSSGSTAITSDENLKDIYEIDEKYVEFFKNLKPITYIYKNRHRNHMGFGARQVEQALKDAGLTTEQFAGVLIDKNETLSADEMATKEPVHFDELYSLRYEEFIALNTLMIQRHETTIAEQAKVIKSLKDEITNMKAEIENLKAKIV